MSDSAVCRTVRRNVREEPQAPVLKRKGRRAGSGRSLSDEQSAHSRRLICEKRPEQMKMDFALWSRAAVLALMEDECGVAPSIRAVGDYLKRWGLTPQKPIKRAYEQSAPVVALN